jgi:outer membrane biosynthesis protein TonB
MARGTGTRRALSEANISDLIRGNPEALAAQAAKGGNTKPVPATAPTPTPAANPAAAPTTPTPAAAPTQPTPTAQAPTPAANPATPAATPTTKPTKQPKPAKNPAAPAEEEQQAEREVRYRDVQGSGPQFLFGMSGKGDINEGADAATQEGLSKELLKKLTKKIAAQRAAQGPTPPAGPTK